MAELVVFNPIRAQLQPDNLYFNRSIWNFERILETDKFNKVWKINRTFVPLPSYCQKTLSFATNWPTLQNYNKSNIFCAGFSLKWDIVPFIIDKDWVVIRELVMDFTDFDLQDGLKSLPKNKIISLKEII